MGIGLGLYLRRISSTCISASFPPECAENNASMSSALTSTVMIVLPGSAPITLMYPPPMNFFRNSIKPRITVQIRRTDPNGSDNTICI